MELFPEEVSRRAPHLLEELGGGDAVGGAHVPVEPPLLREDGLAADEPALVAPRLLRLDLVRARGLLRGLQNLQIGVDGLLVGGPDVHPQVGLVN